MMDSKNTDGIKVNKGAAPRYYADAAGNYLGGWADMPCPIPGAVEVNPAPPTADQKRVGNAWVPTLSTVTSSTGTGTTGSTGTGTGVTVTTPVGGASVKL